MTKSHVLSAEDEDCVFLHHSFSSLLHRRSRDIRAKKLVPVVKKDQTTSTCDDEAFELSSQSGPSRSLTERGGDEASVCGGSVVANPSAVADDLSALKAAELTLTDGLFFYNQPVGVLHAPAFFHLEEQEWSRSATLPRAAAEPANKDAQTLNPAQNLAAETEDQLVEGQATTSSTSRGHFSLPESVSVPGTLNKIRDSGHLALCRSPSAQAPRAWFVSLEGKPAAEIHYAVSEQQRRRRPAESRETSLDSGVDMSELGQSSGRRTVTLERNATFLKSTSRGKPPPPQ